MHSFQRPMLEVSLALKAVKPPPKQTTAKTLLNTMYCTGGTLSCRFACFECWALTYQVPLTNSSLSQLTTRLFESHVGDRRLFNRLTEIRQHAVTLRELKAKLKTARGDYLQTTWDGGSLRVRQVSTSAGATRGGGDAEEYKIRVIPLLRAIIYV